MTATHSQQIVDGYLARLDRELRDRAVAGRAELIAQVESHIAEARAALDTETDVDLLNILDRLGSPDLVAEGARVVGGTAPIEPPQQQTLFAATVIPGLLIVAWPLGVIRLLYSGAWSRIERSALAGLALIGPVLITPYLWSRGFTWYSRLADFFWNPATISCLLVAIILVWRSDVGRRHTVGWAGVAGSRVLGSVALCFVWLGLEYATRFLPY
jgi:uncharacterized membrane protein